MIMPEPTSGRAAICGYDVVSEKNTNRRATGSFFQDPIYIGILKLKEGSYIT
jgi:ABC-type multidrug transport system ATPase subunit